MAIKKSRGISHDKAVLEYGEFYVEAAWAAINSDEYWKQEYQRRVYRCGSELTVSIARRLVGVARALARSNSLSKRKPLLKEVA